METIKQSPLLDQNDQLEIIERSDFNEEQSLSTTKSSKGFSKWAKIGFAVCGALLIALVVATVCTFSTVSSSLSNQEWEELPNCGIHQQPSCSGSDGEMIDEFKTGHQWNTPPRGTERWIPGFQDMNVLTGYAQLKYASGLKQCTVNIITKTAKDLDLTYYFDGVGQKSNSKTFDSSYTNILKVKIQAASGESLELDDIDFIWNVQQLGQTKYDTRNGQKGAVVEMFGWPDDDIALECQKIAEAGYMGVKTFPHQEQVMSYQPMENMLNPWYFMYQPVSYRLQGRMGSRTQLRNMINTCRKLGVRVYADAVVNHMSGNGNDMGHHRNPGASCTYWDNKTSSAPQDMGSPYYTPAYTYQTNQYTGRGTNVLEYPGVPYGPMDFHCDKAVNAWDNGHVMSTGWLTGLVDLDTSTEYVQQRIADYFVDMMSIGFTGFRMDAAKHIHPKDIAAIFGKFKKAMGGSLPEDFLTYLEVLTGGESQILLGDGDYSYTITFTNHLKDAGLDDREIETIKIWWANYPERPDYWGQYLPNTRKAIQNDDHDQQNDGSTSRDMHDKGCVLVSKKCSIEDHRRFEVKLFQNPEGTSDNDNDFPIRIVLSSYWLSESYGGKTLSPPDGKSDCSTMCTTTCSGCKGRPYVKAYQENAKAYEGDDYTRVHRDTAIINAMRSWMHLDPI